ncbi:Crp/Fnr family transcriptional regulator [Chitinophaga agrisoli]|uniref:Crp/Fnr family transcriptional regulator n=1 Tax=Chitinophaga agrisoli TaxID=2607653 RepID=A0A5B2VKI5_9BACT|nr:Crp/Fnr family transcriptional regulator [Chitinophaga agrisoli]KAA2238802.1 Crp/Fnr family transcriptional regulator [Chitinophaga agrisoli]
MLSYLMKTLDGVHRPLSFELREAIAGIVQHANFRKGEYLLKPRQTCNYLYFVQSGLVRAYEKVENGEITHWFMQEGDMITAPESFFNQVPSDEYVQALEDVEVYYISYEETMRLVAEYREFLLIYAILMVRYYLKSIQRERGLRRSAAIRFASFAVNHPELAKRVPQKYIASFLGMTERTYGQVKKGSTFRPWVLLSLIYMQLLSFFHWR